MTKFIGRLKELESLKGLLRKKSSSLVVIRGRRRIGKSRLAEEYASSFSKAYILGSCEELGAPFYGEVSSMINLIYSYQPTN